MALELQQHDYLKHPLRKEGPFSFPLSYSHLSLFPFANPLILLFKFKTLKLSEVPLQAMNPNGKGPRLDLKLNLSPPRAKRTRMELPNRSGSSSSSTSPTSPPSSCVSSEFNSGESDQGQTLGYANSPEATSMVLVGCPRCLMYVMLSEDDPRCPKCKSTVLLDFLNDNNKSSSSRSSNNNNYRVNNQ